MYTVGVKLRIVGLKGILGDLVHGFSTPSLQARFSPWHWQSSSRWGSLGPWEALCARLGAQDYTGPDPGTWVWVGAVQGRETYSGGAEPNPAWKPALSHSFGPGGQNLKHFSSVQPPAQSRI